MSCQMKLLEDTFFLLLLSGTWCLCVMQLLWSKETSRTMTKFIYDQYSFTVIVLQFKAAYKGIPCM